MKREENERKKKYLRNKGRIRRNKEADRDMGGPVREAEAGREESEINSINKEETRESTKNLKQQKFNEDLTLIPKECLTSKK